MKNILILILMSSFVVSCATKERNTMTEKYGRIRVSPEAKKTLAAEIKAGKSKEETDVICDRVYKTGSRIPVVTCKTYAEHKEDKKRSKEAAERMRRDSNLNMSKTLN